jgi:hypothetical protein
MTLDTHTAHSIYTGPREHLADHIANAPLADRIAARRHAHVMVETGQAKRDEDAAAGEAALPKARAVVAKARQALADALAEEARIIGAIDQVAQTYADTVGVVELRLAEHPDQAAEAALAVSAGGAA